MKNNMTVEMTAREKDLYTILFDKYGSNLDVSTTVKVLKKSPSTLYRMRQMGIGPGYIRDDTKSNNSAIRYPLHEIVHYLCKTNEEE